MGFYDYLSFTENDVTIKKNDAETLDHVAFYWTGSLEALEAKLRCPEETARRATLIEYILADHRRKRTAEQQLSVGLTMVGQTLRDDPERLLADPLRIERIALALRITASEVAVETWPALHGLWREFEEMARSTAAACLSISAARRKPNAYAN